MRKMGSKSSWKIDVEREDKANWREEEMEGEKRQEGLMQYDISGC